MLADKMTGNPNSMRYWVDLENQIIKNSDSLKDLHIKRREEGKEQGKADAVVQNQTKRETGTEKFQ